MTDQEIYQRLAGQFPEAGLVRAGGRVPATVVPSDRLREVCLFLRDDPELRVDYPASITAVDYLDRFELIYQLRSMAKRHDVNLKTRVGRDDPTLPSVVEVWPGADFQEREIFDLMGITFVGHPNMSRILLWDEFVGYPLRKDFGIPAPLPAAVEVALQEGGVAAANEVGRVVPGPRGLDEHPSERSPGRPG
ncbi:MAG TPA: NADH-quinone oxidoreductase subunit C [Chloroflexota bacterium]